MTVSLVVSTRNRGARLQDFFASLTRLESPVEGWELILVDNGSTDATGEPSANLPQERPSPSVAPRRHAGAVACPNAGIRSAAGRIVAFTDDDCYPQPDYLRAIVDVFERHQAGVLGGRVVLHDPADARVG